MHDDNRPNLNAEAQARFGPRALMNKRSAYDRSIQANLFVDGSWQHNHASVCATCIVCRVRAEEACWTSGDESFFVG
jgi:hypothetical protein